MSTEERWALAKRLGLRLFPLASTEWVGGPEDGKVVHLDKWYWMHGSLPHSGSFYSEEEALAFLAARCAEEPVISDD